MVELYQQRPAMTLKTRRVRKQLLKGKARSLEFLFVSDEPRNFHGEPELCRIDALRTPKQSGVPLEMRPCSWTTVCECWWNRPSGGPDVNASGHQIASRTSDMRTTTTPR